MRRLGDITDERNSEQQTDRLFWEFIDWANADRVRYALVLRYLVADVAKIQRVFGPEDRLWAEMLRLAPGTPAKEVLRRLTDARIVGSEELMGRLLDAFEGYPDGQVRLLVGLMTCVVGLKCSLGGWFSIDSPAA